MRLKKIKLAGFKSFVDPTTVLTPSNLVCVVGPNGCGKSNTIDAVRWVMGESSAKNLRGSSMADVIFNGSSSRKPVGQASVELVFENTQGRLGGEYSQYSEISIKRIVSRDGQSSYHLNGTRCRRRDITDIFLGTGLGPRSYAIIEQGTVSRMIEAKPEELRVFIEEAAGISKYKERRRETETRIRHTRENLERISDLCDELDKRLATLQRQARTAERYKELKEEERVLKAQLLALRFQNLDTLVNGRDQAVKSEETKLISHMTELSGIDTATEDQREQQIEANEHFNEIQGRYYAVGSEIARLEQSIHHSKDSRSRHEKELDDVEHAWQEAQTHRDSDNEAIETLKMDIEVLDEQLFIVRDSEQESAAMLVQAEDNMQAWQSEWDDFNRQSSEQVRKAEVERARIQHLERNFDQLSHRITRLEDERASLSAGDLEEEIELLQLQREELSEQLSQLKHELEQQRDTLTQEREMSQTLSSELNAERSRLQSLEGRKSSLEALQQQALGKQKNAVNDWLQANELGDAQRLAQSLEVDSGWERAVETVLGLNLESVCVSGLSKVSHSLGELSQGSLGLFDVSALAPMYPRATEAVALSDKVRSSQALDSLLGGVYVAEDLAQAMSLRVQLQARESVITAEGVWLGPDWLRLHKGNDEKSGVLARENELKELALEIEETAARVDEREELLSQGRTRLHDLEQGREELQSSLNQSTQLLAQAESQLTARQERLQQHWVRKERLQKDIAELFQQRTQDEEQLAQARARLDEALMLNEESEYQREALNQRRDEIKSQLDEMRDRARNDRDSAHEIALKLQACRSQVDGTQQRLLRTDGQLQHFSKRRDELRAQLASDEDPVVEMTMQLEELLQQRLMTEDDLTQARKKVEEIDLSLRQLTEQRHQVDRKVQDVRGELEKLRMGGQEYRVRCQTVKEQFDETGFVMAEVLAQLSEDASEDRWADEVVQIAQKIQRLGAINLAAIDEYAEQSERKRYLDEQQNDLNEALSILENAIRKIDKETRTRFKDTFDKVNSGVKELFPRLFGGGHAYLDLTGDDLLDTGVTIMARPPGKRNSSIHLLSGGEKALTAVALVFSIFQLNPAPFCMLDEVDAPLDEANVGRFCELVKAMSETVQFVFITHNKTTMEMGDHLSGVTMHEPGVSRLVAVDMEEAVQMAGL